MLANVSDQAGVWTCVEQNCVRRYRWKRWAHFGVHDASLTNPQPVDVRVVVRDRGGVVFDATRQVQLFEEQPNGPGCEPTLLGAAVRATPDGDLIQQIFVPGHLVMSDETMLMLRALVRSGSLQGLEFVHWAPGERLE